MNFVSILCETTCKTACHSTGQHVHIEGNTAICWINLAAMRQFKFKKMDDIIFWFAFSSILLYSGIILFLIMHSILFYTPTPLQWMIIRFTRYNVTYLTREPVVRLWTDAFSPRTVEIRICLLKRWIRTYLLNADTDLCPKWFLRNAFVLS